MENVHAVTAGKNPRQKLPDGLRMLNMQKNMGADCDAKFLPPNDQGNGPRQAQLAEGPR